MSTFNTNAIVLGYENRGEYDRVYYLFTEKYGKMSVLAKGSQKILSKLGPHLEPPAISKVMIAKGKMIDKLAGAEIKKSFSNIRKNFHKREILFFCFKMVNLSTRPEGADEGVYKFLKDFIKFLEKIPDTNKKDVKTSDVLRTSDVGTIGKRVPIIISFLVKFFSLIGFHPDFDTTPTSSPLYKEKVEKWVSGILDKEIKIS